MTPSKRSLILGISFFLLLPSVTSAADELADPADLVELASREQQLRAQADDQLRAWVVAATADEGDALASRITKLLLQHTRRVVR